MPGSVDLLPTIIVVEDDEDIARLIQHHLKLARFITHWFKTATGVVDAAENEPPALFLLDLMIPGIDGFHLCRIIRKHDALRSVPILILTARTSQQDRIRAFESGADDYVTKPFSRTDLISRVRTLCADAEQMRDLARLPEYRMLQT